MPRHTETVSHGYGQDSELSFGELLLKVLTFPAHEIAADMLRAAAAGIETGTTPEKVKKARVQKSKNDTTIRRKEARLNADRKQRRAA